MDLFDDKAALVLVMAWCHEATTWTDVDQDLERMLQDTKS